MKKTTSDKIEGVLLFASTVITLIIAVQVFAGSVQLRYKIIDPELRPYVVEYHNLLNRYCTSGNYSHTNHYVIELLDELDKPDQLGLCSFQLNGFHIGIKRSTWKAMDEDDRRQLIYHELAHCVIDREHDKNPKHYMYYAFSTIPTSALYLQATQDMVDHCAVE